MLKIKLTPVGKKNHREYRVVVINDREKLTGRAVAQLGTYNPHAKSDQVKIQKDDYQSWLGKGAQPTQTVKNLFAKAK